jgi:DNA-binding transcriptional MerR regulator
VTSDGSAGSGQCIPVEEAVRTLGVSRSTIDRYRRRGLLDSYRAVCVDRRVYIDPEQLKELRRNPPLRVGA